jgi:aarF domain-containing kinase
MEWIRERGSVLWPGNFVRLLRAWTSYVRVEVKLELYELWLSLRGNIGLAN